MVENQNTNLSKLKLIKKNNFKNQQFILFNKFWELTRLFYRQLIEITASVDNQSDL